jgi:hypothetical protein
MQYKNVKISFFFSCIAYRTSLLNVSFSKKESVIYTLNVKKSYIDNFVA